MVSPIDKCIIAILIPLLTYANQRWGLAIPVDPATLLPIVAAVSGALVYAIPNKAA